MKAIVRVGKGGRGFFVLTREGSLVITAAHCLPSLPPPHPSSYTVERTYAQLLGPLGHRPTIWAECLFADPVADIAVLAEPDSQVLSDKWEAFTAFAEERAPVRVARLPKPSAGWLLTKGSDWRRCTLTPSAGAYRSSLSVSDYGAADAIERGTSGSPILAVDGRVVGVMSTGDRGNPLVADALPARMVRMFGRI